MSDENNKFPAAYLASPQRASGKELSNQIASAMKSLSITCLLQSCGNIVAVLNKHRQVIAVNDGFLQYLGISNAQKLLGLRPGEVFHCVLSHDCLAG